MSDETISGSEEAVKDAAPAPKTRRISNKNPRKSAKVAKAARAVKPPEDTPEKDVPVEEFDSSPPAEASETETNTGDSPDPKRKNRRRRGKGKSKEGEAETENVSEETIQLVDTNPDANSARDDRQQSRPQQQKQRPQHKQRSRPDPEKVAKNAWKIFLAEVSEEGVALIGDNDARELARRCFRLSEIFIEEEQRRN